MKMKLLKKFITYKIKNMKNLFLIAVIVLGFSAVSFGQDLTATLSSNNASATIIAPITIANGTALNFGTAGASAYEATTVVLALDNSRDESTANLFSVGAPAAAGVFQITGTPDALFSITLPTAITELSGPGTVMTIASSSWVRDLGTSPVILPNGTQILKVGATLNVGANQAAGDYLGTYAVTVAYN